MIKNGSEPPDHIKRAEEIRVLENRIDQLTIVMKIYARQDKWSWSIVLNRYVWCGDINPMMLARAALGEKLPRENKQ